MVLLLVDWGMGDCNNKRNYVTTTTTTANLLQNASTTTTTTGNNRNLLRGESAEVDLLPLTNQVGGHTRLMVLNPSTICKPLNFRELDFYQNIQDQAIKAFVPKYKGVMQATVCSGGKLEKRYSPSFRDECTSSSTTTTARSTKSDRKRKREDVLKMRIHHTGHPQEVLDSISRQHSDSNKQYFLMLENITSHYTHPCILDLKMGTRQHGDDASAEKRSKQMAKCAASTSGTLGVRLCGMQTYQAKSDVYFKKDKYWGRELNEDGFKHALYQFFDNGFGLRQSVIRRVIQKLEQLRRVIEQQSCYRFYSCSLLIVYEGNGGVPIVTIPSQSADDYLECTRQSEENSRETPCCYDADTSNSSIDFNSSHDEVSQDSHHRGFGEAAARGAKSGTFYPISEETVFLDSSPNLNIPSISTSSPMSCDSWMVYSNSSSDEYSLSGHLNGGGATSSDTSDFESLLSSPHKTKKRNCTKQFADLDLDDDNLEEEDDDDVKQQNGGSGPKSNMAVDVRMIDFAHTSFAHTKSNMAATSTSTSSAVQHYGPDGGFLTGLDSLKRLLSQILAEG